MRKTALSVFVMVPVVFAAGFASPSLAATTSTAVPQTKCVTASTKQTQANAEAQMEKDVAPYANNAAVSDVVAKYRADLTETCGRPLDEIQLSLLAEWFDLGESIL